MTEHFISGTEYCVRPGWTNELSFGLKILELHWLREVV